MPKYHYQCPVKHEFDLLVPHFKDYACVMCEVPDPNGEVKILEDDGETIVCGRDAVRIDEASVPARRNPAHGIM